MARVTIDVNPSKFDRKIAEAAKVAALAAQAGAEAAQAAAEALALQDYTGTMQVADVLLHGPVSVKEHMENTNNPHGITNEQINAVNKNNLYFDPGGRSVIRYKDANSIYVSGRAFMMSGFRFGGQYLKGRGRYAELTAASRAYASLINDLGCQTAKDVLNWYAVFACCNTNDANAALKIMPYFRISSVSGNVITLGNGGENSDPSIIKNYNMNNNVFNNTDVLVITEKLGTNNSNSFSGRVAKLTANTNYTLTIDDVGTLEQGDYLLPAPPGYSDYRYLGSFYVDSAEVRNIADSGVNVATRGVNVTGLSISGALIDGVKSIAVTNGGSGYSTAPTVSFVGGGGSGAATTATIAGGAVTGISVTNTGTDYTSEPTIVITGGGGSGAEATVTLSAPVKFSLAGLICPLATAGIINIRHIMSTSGTGSFILTVRMDKSHDYYHISKYKTTSSSEAHLDSGIVCPFLFGQQVVVSSGTTNMSISSATSRQVDVRGWIEP